MPLTPNEELALSAVMTAKQFYSGPLRAQLKALFPVPDLPPGALDRLGRAVAADPYQYAGAVVEITRLLAVATQAFAACEDEPSVERLAASVQRLDDTARAIHALFLQMAGPAPTEEG